MQNQMESLTNTSNSLDNGDIQSNFNILKAGQSIKFNKRDDATLVLGNTGSGKSTFVYFITGNDDNLISRETGEDTGEFIIEDTNDKISKSDSTITSRTIFPELALDTTENQAYYDCPGFGDSRSSSHDIAATYFTKAAIDSANTIKIIFLVNYPSVRSGVDRDDFKKLVENAVSMVKNIKKFEKSIALIVTKVDNTYVKKGHNFVLVPDNTVKKSIAGFLKDFKKNLTPTMLKNPNLYNSAKDFIDILLTKDNEQYSRIGIFRRPDESGNVKNIQLLQDNKVVLKQILQQNIQYMSHDYEDFGYTISSESQNHLYSLAEMINKNIVSNIMNIAKEIKNYYYNSEKQLGDIEKLRYNFENAYNYLVEKKASINKFTDAQELIDEITKIINDLKIELPNMDVLSIKENTQYLKFIKIISDEENNRNIKIKPLDWAQGLLDVIEYLNSSQKWYNFLNNLFIILSTYDIQQEINQYRNIANELKLNIELNKDQNIQIMKYLKNFLEKVLKHDSERVYDIIKDVNLDSWKIQSLKNVFDSTLNYEVASLCDSESETLVLKGQYIKLSDIVKQNCNLSKYIELFALNKVFIDTDFNKQPNQVQLSIIAPTWDIVGGPKIILSGEPGKTHDSSKARDGVGTGANGEDGVPGKPGGSAGHFFGIGETFINGQFLKISSNGGVGGPAQNGGNGINGENGSNPRVPTKGIKEECGDTNSCTTSKSMYGSPCELINIDSYFAYGNFYVDYTYRLYGSQGEKGGNGGRGGQSGKGGYPGKITLTELNSPSKIEKSNVPGMKGTIGYGGLPGVSGRDGDDFDLPCSFVSSSDIIIPIKVWRSYKIVQKDKKWLSGIRGKDNDNDRNIKDPDIVPSQNPSIILNKYKSYFRENLTKNIKKSSFGEFLNKLENGDSIMSFYDIKGLIHDLRELESQFYNQRNKFSFLPFYEFLLMRINQYSATRTLSMEHKKVLSYLKTATLGKIYSLNNNIEDDLVLNIEKYLDSAISDINELERTQTVVSIDNYKKRYEKIIKDKISEAQNFIDNQITEEINNDFDQIDDQMKHLIEETIEMEKQSEKERDELIKKEAELGKLFLLKHFLGTIKVASRFLSFLGPVGTAAGLAIEGGITVAETFALNEPSSTDLSPLAALPSAVKTGVTTITEQVKNKQLAFDFQLRDVEKQLEEFTRKEPTVDVKDIERNILDTRNKLNSEIEKGATLDPESVDKIYNMRKELTESLESKQNALKSSKPDVELKIKEQMAFVSGMQKIVGIGEVSVELYKTIRNDNAKLELIASKIKQAEIKFEKLRAFEKNIYHTIIPTCRKMQNKVEDIEKNLHDRSHVSLDISKWQIQSTLGDVKLQLQKLTKGFSIAEDLSRSYEKLEEGISTMINVYDRIQDYHDTAELAAYIADINSDRSASIEVKDTELQIAVDDLNSIIYSNLVLGKYGVALNAFRQCVFPFANYYLDVLNLPSALERTDNHSLSLAASNVIKQMKSEISAFKSTGTDYDKHIHRKIVFDSSSQQTTPFYIWKHSTNKHAISKLLEGEEITIKADVSQLSDKNAIKFNEIGINFKAADETVQNELNDKLKNFEVTMIHQGNSYYRCNSNVYVIPSAPQTITYYVAKKENGEPQDFNLTYEKIKNNEPVLSPYAMWKIKLININNNVETLAMYKNQVIDLELKGKGQYVSNKTSECYNDLKKYYKLDYTISKINVNDQENLETVTFIKSSSSPSMHHHVGHSRNRRSLNKSDLIQNTENSDKTGNFERSFSINKFVRLFNNSLRASNFSSQITNELNVDDITNVLSNKNVFAVSEVGQIYSLHSNPPDLIGDFTRNPENESSTPLNNIINDSLLYNNGNLMLLDLLIRSKKGEKYNHKNNTVKNSPDLKHAHSLAYKEYVPQDGDYLNDDKSPLHN